MAVRGDADPVVGWLVTEATEVGKRIAEFMLTGERILAIGFGVLTVTANVVIARDRSHYLMFLPLLSSAVLAFNAHLNSELAALGGYKAALEEEITRRVGTAVILWETVVAPQRHKALPLWMFRAHVTLLWLASLAIGIGQALATGDDDAWGHEYSRHWIAATVTSVVVSVVAVGLATWDERKEYERTRAKTAARLAGRSVYVTAPDGR